MALSRSDVSGCLCGSELSVCALPDFPTFAHNHHLFLGVKLVRASRLWLCGGPQLPVHGRAFQHVRLACPFHEIEKDIS